MMKKAELFLPWIVVCVATVFSLFISEMRHMKPCTLCWYQRIIMFPLAVILGIAAFRNAYRIVFYVLPLSLIGLAISAYHVIMLNFFSDVNFCSSCMFNPTPNPITFPVLALITFVVLNALLIWIAIKHHRSKKL